MNREEKGSGVGENLDQEREGDLQVVLWESI